jgi:hypothetical protein
VIIVFDPNDGKMNGLRDTPFANSEPTADAVQLSVRGVVLPPDAEWRP